MSALREFNNLKIQMKDIIVATNNFCKDNVIGSGGFGPVFKGELSLPMGPTTVAFKCLDLSLSQQGNVEFWKEIVMLSKYKHENLISLMHFCNEGVDRVLVYEYASRGSLDKYLDDVGLTWTKRLDICIGAAHAIRYLHDPLETQERILHRDIKSANILLDENWTAKVSDFGYSRIGPANQQHTSVFSTVVGTFGYCDPVYVRTGKLSKESDVYSFGVVLFEVMCGRLCCEYIVGGAPAILVHNWRKCFAAKKLDEIVFQELKEEMDLKSLTTFSTIANQCISRDPRHRPTMDEIVEQLHVALEQQNVKNQLLARDRPERTQRVEIAKELDVPYQHKDKKARTGEPMDVIEKSIEELRISNHRDDLVKISKLAVTPLSYKSQKQLILLLFKGVLIEDGKRWVSINKNEEILEMIPATQCIQGKWLEHTTDNDSRFSNILSNNKNCLHYSAVVKTQFLSPYVRYSINLVFKSETNGNRLLQPIEYKMENETYYSKVTDVQVREDGWLMCELLSFTSRYKQHDFKIEFVQFVTFSSRHFEGIEFRPMKL